MRIHDLISPFSTIEEQISEGDIFYLELGDLLIETTVAKILPDGVVIHADNVALSYLTLDSSNDLKRNFSELEIAIMEGGGSLDEAEYQGRKVDLGKPFLTPDGPKKRSVYVKNPKGNIVKVNFGDKNMKIKKSNPERRKNFRARHNCENPGPKWRARYWSCRAW